LSMDTLLAWLVAMRLAVPPWVDAVA